MKNAATVTATVPTDCPVTKGMHDSFIPASWDRNTRKGDIVICTSCKRTIGYCDTARSEVYYVSAR